MIKKTMAVTFGAAIAMFGAAVPAHALSGSETIPVTDPTGCAHVINVSFNTDNPPPRTVHADGNVTCTG